MTVKAQPPAPAVAPLTAIPAGYAILPFGRAHCRPVLVVATGDGLWTRPLYREPSTDGRTGVVCASQAEALTVIARHQAWRKRQDELERAQTQGEAKAASARKGGR